MASSRSTKRIAGAWVQALLDTDRKHRRIHRSGGCGQIFQTRSPGSVRCAHRTTCCVIWMLPVLAGLAICHGYGNSR